MEGEKSFERFSPEVRIRAPAVKNSASLLPTISLFHGTGDYSIPADARLVVEVKTQTEYGIGASWNQKQLA